MWAQIEHGRDRPDRIARLRQRYADDTLDVPVSPMTDTFDVPVSPMADTERVFAALAGGHGGAG